MKNYIIQNTDFPDLFWSKKTGWSFFNNAFFFSEEEKNTFELPVYGEWVGPIQNYKVIYEIDVEAANPMHASLQVEDIMKNMEYRPVLKTISNDNKKEEVDLECLEYLEIK